MNLLKRPIGVTAALLAVVIVLQLTKLGDIAWQIGSVYIFLIVAIFIHELGHAVAGKMIGYEFHFMSFGPFTIEPRGLLWNERWFAFGGLTNCTPKIEDVETIAKKHKWYVLAGPVFSYIGMFGGFIFAFLFDNNALNLFAFINLALLIVTAIPMKTPLKTDGYIYWHLRKGGEEAHQLVSSVLLHKRMMSPESPKKWPPRLIEQAKKVPVSLDETLNSYMIFYYELMQQDFKQASESIAAYKDLPLEGGLKRQFITHIQQIDCLLSGDATLEEIQSLHNTMKPLEKVSYLRSEAIIAALKGEHEVSKAKLFEAQQFIKAEREKYGFYEAEQKLFDTVEDALKMQYLRS